MKVPFMSKGLRPLATAFLGFGLEKLSMQSQSHCLKESHTKDTIVIIGGGISGVSTALHLARMGYSGPILVVEREHVGAPHLASSVNSGLLETAEGSASNEENWSDFLSRKSLSFYADLSKKGHDIEFDIRNPNPNPNPNWRSRYKI